MARSESIKWQPASIERAIQLLCAARELIGDNALIQATLGRVYLQSREAGIGCSDRPLNNVREILNQLEFKHPGEFSTLSLTAWYEYLTGNIGNAIYALKSALSL